MERPGYVECGACGLSHPARRDWLCPRCGKDVRARTSAVAVPSAVDDAGAAGTGAGAHVFAGWIFVLLGLLGLAAGVFALQDPYATRVPLAPQLGAAAASLAELLLGGFIVAGVARARTIAIALCVLGAVATIPIAIVVGGRVGMAVAVLRLVLVVGSLLLLVGRPGTGRTAIGGLLVTAHLLLRLRLAWEAAQFAGHWSDFWKVWQ